MGAFTSSRDWGRVLTAMITPFHADGTVNFPEARRVARYLVDQQANDGLIICGTTGESPTLKEGEKLQLLEEVLDEVGERAAIIFGTGTYDTAESIHLTKVGAEKGAHGILLVNPYYNRPGQAGLYAHFKAIASETDLPVMLYNIQPRSAINLETPTLLKLAEIPNIVAVKEASGNIAQISDVCRLKPDGFRVYSGDDALTLPILALGGHGIVSVAAHICGNEIKEMVDMFLTNPIHAMRIHHRLTPLVQALFSAPSPVPVKYAMSLYGFDSETVRLPLVELSEAEKAIVFKAVNDFRAIGH